MSLTIWNELEQQLEQRKAQHLYRQRAVVSSPADAMQKLNGKLLSNFCSNDYLGLANHPQLIEAAIAANKSYGVGSGGSHLVSGHSEWHHRLEDYFAELTGRESALLFSTGYMANMGVISALLNKADAIFEDRLNHASLLDAGLLSGARFQRFLHNDMENLQVRLERSQARRRMICVDGVYSMDGDLAPVDKLAILAKQHDALLMVDDAHGFGVLGNQGLGVCEQFALTQQEVPILMCTLGKALGSFGAIVAGPKLLIDSLIQYARPYIYTTALPPAVAATSLAALKLMQKEAWRREHLQQLIRHFQKESALLGLPISQSTTAIQPLLVGDERLALQWQEKLREAGFWLSAIRPPTVAVGTARLRITLSAAHSFDDVDALLSTLKITYQQIQ